MLNVIKLLMKSYIVLIINRLTKTKIYFNSVSSDIYTIVALKIKMQEVNYGHLLEQYDLSDD